MMPNRNDEWHEMCPADGNVDSLGIPLVLLCFSLSLFSWCLFLLYYCGIWLDNIVLTVIFFVKNTCTFLWKKRCPRMPWRHPPEPFSIRMSDVILSTYLSSEGCMYSDASVSDCFHYTLSAEPSGTKFVLKIAKTTDKKTVIYFCRWTMEKKNRDERRLPSPVVWRDLSSCPTKTGKTSAGLILPVRQQPFH